MAIPVDKETENVFMHKEWKEKEQKVAGGLRYTAYGSLDRKGLKIMAIGDDEGYDNP